MATRTSSKTREPRNREDQEFLRKYGEKLSSTIQRAKWIESEDDKPERKGQSLVTRRHEVIKRWAEERGASPATVESTRVLRFDFPGYGGQSLKKISWDDWLKAFDDRNLVFLYQEQLRNGNQSNFFRLDSPSREEA